jgi:hypothetical protein
LIQVSPLRQYMRRWWSLSSLNQISSIHGSYQAANGRDQMMAMSKPMWMVQLEHLQQARHISARYI